MNPFVRGIALGLALYAAYLGLLALIVWVYSEWQERRRRWREELLREWYRVLSSEGTFTVYQNHYGSGEPLEFPAGAISQADPGGVRLVRLTGPASGEVFDVD